MKTEAEVKITEKFISSHLSFGILMEIRKYNTLRMHSSSAQNTLEHEHEQEAAQRNITEFPQYSRIAPTNTGIAMKREGIPEAIVEDCSMQDESSVAYSNSVDQGNANANDNGVLNNEDVAAMPMLNASHASTDKIAVPNGKPSETTPLMRLHARLSRLKNSTAAYGNTVTESGNAPSGSNTVTGSSIMKVPAPVVLNTVATASPAISNLTTNSGVANTTIGNKSTTNVNDDKDDVYKESIFNSQELKPNMEEDKLLSKVVQLCEGDTFINDATSKSLLAQFKEPIIGFNTKTHLIGMDRRLCAVIAIKMCGDSHSSSALSNMSWHMLMECIDGMAAKRKISCVRKFGNVWIGCLGFLDSWKNFCYDSYYTIDLAVAAVKLAGEHNLRVCCAVDYGSVVGGFVVSYL